MSTTSFPRSRTQIKQSKCSGGSGLFSDWIEIFATVTTKKKIAGLVKRFVRGVQKSMARVSNRFILGYNCSRLSESRVVVVFSTSFGILHLARIPALAIPNSLSLILLALGWSLSQDVYLGHVSSDNASVREFDIFTKLLYCVCEAMAELLNCNKFLKLMQFLMGLDALVTGIMIMEEEIILEVKDAFVIISREKSHRRISPTSVSLRSLRLLILCLELMIMEEETMVMKLMSLLNEKFVSSAHANMVVDISKLKLTGGHPNGTLAKITHVGNQNLNNDVVLFEDLKKEKVLGSGSEFGGLNVFDKEYNKPVVSNQEINYFCHFLDILQNYDLKDDETMWVADRVVAPTPGSAITIPETPNEFAIKGNHLTLVKGNQFDGRIKIDPHKHILEFLRICDMFKYKDTENEAVRLMMFPLSLTGEAKT
ncbi:hypothetical protein Tco_0025553 [Tanacetum coccineum]